MRKKGWLTSWLSLCSRSASRGSPRSRASSASMAARSPATVPLMPSRARSKVPLMFFSRQNSRSGSRMASKSSSRANLYSAAITVGSPDPASAGDAVPMPQARAATTSTFAAVAAARGEPPAPAVAGGASAAVAAAASRASVAIAFRGLPRTPPLPPPPPPPAASRPAERLLAARSRASINRRPSSWALLTRPARPAVRRVESRRAESSRAVLCAWPASRGRMRARAETGRNRAGRGHAMRHWVSRART
mmetsp:Transcript_13006/g.41545  ORF Transcript_13006/g.41545 Transcript_13006/m.41545 type:complete len:249 (+) Transcript_13006:907-1653(+)